MKKLLLILCFFMFYTGIMFGQSVGITAPKEGEELQKGQFYTIRWTTNGYQEKLDIDLYSENPRKRLWSKKNILNTGAYNWQIPMDSYIVPGAGYRIFIVKSSGELLGLSKIFKIVASKKLTFRGKRVLRNVTGRPDFDVTGIYLTNDNKFRAKIKNLGADWRGTLWFEGTIGARKFRFSNSLTINKDQEVEIVSQEKATLKDASCPNPNILLVAKIDPDNRIVEREKKNNVQYTFFKHNLPRPDYIVKRVEAVHRFMAADKNSLKQTGTDYHIVVKNKGKSYRGRIFLKIVDTDTDGNKLYLFVEKKDIYFYAGEEKSIRIGSGPQLIFYNKILGRADSIQFRVRAKVIAGQFNCELKEKRDNNTWEGFVVPKSI